MRQFVAFSGGKDSTALALLEPDAIPVFNDTGWEFPAVYEHIERFEKVTGRKVLRIRHGDFTLPEYIRHSAFLPGHRARFCTRMFKIEVTHQFLESEHGATIGIGLRADEPLRTGDTAQIEGLTVNFPLREKRMGLMDVIRACTEYDLLPRYPVYMARGGCMGCYFKRKCEVQAIAAMMPDVIDGLQSLEEEVQDERGKFAYMFPNAGMSIRQIRMQRYLIDPNIVYQAAADKSEMGSCGLFCNR